MKAEAENLTEVLNAVREEEQKRRADLKSQLGVCKTESAAREEMITNLSATIREMMVTVKELNETINTTKEETAKNLTETLNKFHEEENKRVKIEKELGDCKTESATKEKEVKNLTDTIQNIMARQKELNEPIQTTRHSRTEGTATVTLTDFHERLDTSFEYGLAIGVLIGMLPGLLIGLLVCYICKQCCGYKILKDEDGKIKERNANVTTTI